MFGLNFMWEEAKLKAGKDKNGYGKKKIELDVRKCKTGCTARAKLDVCG